MKLINVLFFIFKKVEGKATMTGKANYLILTMLPSNIAN